MKIKIPDIKNLVKNTELTAVENKIPDINSFVIKKLIMLLKLLKLKMTMSQQQH